MIQAPTVSRRKGVPSHEAVTLLPVRHTYIQPPCLLQRVLEVGPIAFPITQHYSPCPRRDQLLSLRHQRDRQRLRAMPFLAAPHSPRQRQRSPLVDHVDHERPTPTAHDAAINDEHQRLQGKMRKERLGLRDNIALSDDVGVLDPPRKACDAALGLGPIRHFRRDFRQWGTLAGHDATDECGQGGQVSRAPALGLTWLSLSEGLSYGTLLTEWSRTTAPCHF